MATANALLRIFVWNIDLAYVGSAEVTKPRFESQSSMEYKLREDGIQSWRLSWLQASEVSNKLLRPKGFRDTVALRCRNLPQVGHLLVDEPGGLAAPGPVCPVLHELRGDGVCRDGAQTRGASRPASKFVDGSPCPAAGVREVDGIPSIAPASVQVEIVGTKRLYQIQSPLGLG